MGGEGPSADVLVDPEWIARHLHDPAVRLVEVDVNGAAYGEGHIPGAVLWDAYVDLRHPDLTPVDPEELAALLRRSGVDPETTIVFYGYGAHLGFWLMSALAHGSLRLMQGSRERWARAGHPWSTDVPQPAPSSYPLGARAGAVLDSRASTSRSIDDPGTLIVDVRSAAEYDGERFWPSGATEGAGRPGRIPGAVHLPVELVRADDGTLRPVEELREVVRGRGLTPDRRVLTYCTIGNRASEVWFALTQALGDPDVDVYYGSWAEWGSRADTPIES